MWKRFLRNYLAPGQLADLLLVRAAVQAWLGHLALSLQPRRALTQVRGTSLLLNLGCGKLNAEGWINVDLVNGAGMYYADLRNPLPLPEGSVRHIHCEHVLEHLEYDEAARLLGDCYRVLGRGGTMRLIVPDAEKYLRAYCRNDPEFFEPLEFLGGSVRPLETRMLIINQMFRMGGAHRFAWDFETLGRELAEKGFADVERSHSGDIAPELRIDGKESWRAHESLYVNVRKSLA